MYIPGYSGRSRGGLGQWGGRLLVIGVVIAGIVAYWFTNQQAGLVKGRHQLITMSVEDEIALGKSSYQELLQSEPILCGQGASSCSKDAGQVVEVVQQVGHRLEAAAKEWESEGAPMTVLGETTGKLPRWGALADKFDWQFNVIQSETPNAFALPGGYVAFYTGLLPTAENVDGIAVIMGHEIGHALARHGAERMSQQLAMQFGQLAVGMAVGGDSISTQRMVMGALGAGAQYGVLLPFSRQHESEADMIGLELVVRACFDPREAPKLWGRMMKLETGGRTPEILSTHPDPEARMKAFEAVMPTAVKLYEARCKKPAEQQPVETPGEPSKSSGD